MAEAIAVVGLVAAIVQFIDASTKIIGRIDNFITRSNEVPVAFRDIRSQLPLLLSDLERTKSQAEQHELALDTQTAVLAVVRGCHKHITALDDILSKVLPGETDSSWRLARKALLSVQQESKVRFIAQELRSNVIYLTHHCVTMMAQKGSGDKIEFVQADERLKMLQWLSIIDPSIYHNRAFKLRESGTGQWFLQSEEYSRWKSQCKGLAWLHGIPGCGKTILCASIIEDLREYCKLHKSKVVAYYYVDFSDTANANVGGILRSLMKQICTSTDRLPKVVESLCSQHRASGQQPSTPSLISVLHALEEELAIQAFIVIDALDEFVEHDRAELLHAILSILGEGCRMIRILVTSREEHDIKLSLSPAATEIVAIENENVDADIKIYVRQRLSEDARLCRLPGHVKDEVELKLGKGAQGMFRWAVCQIDALRSCNKAAAVKKALTNLPKSLYETYERILGGISTTDLADARAIMKWVAFSKRPLTLPEIAEAATVQPGLDEIDPDDKLYDPYDVLRICRSLVTLSEDKIFICGKREVHQTVRFAHASVREYLLSNDIMQGPASSFSMQPKLCHQQVSQCCLSILLRNNTKHQDKSDLEAMPLLKYAAEFWFQHVNESSDIVDGALDTSQGSITEDYICRLFNTTVTIYQNWLTVYDPNIRRGSNRLRGSGPSPLYYVALLGLLGPTRTLLDLGYDVNGHGGIYGTALVAAARNGDEKMVLLLVDRGADINCFGGLAVANPLQAACSSGSEPLVRLLIESGAKVNPNLEGRNHDTPLQVACESGNQNLVRLLIQAGADFNVCQGAYGYALQAAASRGHHQVVSLLLDEGADVNAKGGHYGTALQAAVAKGSESITRLLLDSGADPNIQGGGFRDPLRAAAWRQHQSIFDLLLEHGADVDLSVRLLRDGSSISGRPDHELLADSIHAARAQNSPDLMELVNTAARTIARIELGEYYVKRDANREAYRPNNARARKLIQYILGQERSRYQEASIPSKWLAADRKVPEW